MKTDNDDLTAYLRAQLCARLCVYYKPSKREDIACGGYAVIERLGKSGTVISFDVDFEAPREEDEKRLRGVLCARCPFHESDCDYFAAMSSGKPLDPAEVPPPCGGFVLLLRLLASGRLRIEDIEKAA